MMNGKNCKLRIGGQDIEVMDFDDGWSNCVFPHKENATVSFSGTFDSPSYGNVLYDVLEELQPHKIKLHIDDYMHYEMDGIFKSQEILPGGSITVTMQGDLVKAIFTTIKKQFRMHPQGRNPICWTIERMFG